MILTEDLKIWINTLSYENFSDKKIISNGYSIDDYNRFREVRDKCLASELIDYGDYLIVDFDGDLVLGKWTRRKYKTTSGRLIPIKIIERLRSNENLCVNGYWIVPERFNIK